jgi:glycosyltransferase involved in cell wall biosynthesis
LSLSIIVPSYNEARTIGPLLERLLALSPGWEIVVVDGGSLDGSREILDGYREHPRIKLIFEEKPEGKGAAIQKGIRIASKDIVIIQDADLELFPEEIPSLVAKVDPFNKVAVFGSRFLNASRSSSGATFAANVLFTWMVNVLHFCRLTDVLTCYKAFPRKTGQELKLESKGFDIEVEIASKLMRSGFRIQEVGIKYHPRTRAEGKKIRFRHAFAIFLAVFRYRFWQPPPVLLSSVSKGNEEPDTFHS